MKNNKSFWLYYSLVTAVLLYPYDDAHAVIVGMTDMNTTTDTNVLVDNCVNAANAFQSDSGCGGMGNDSFYRQICQNAYRYSDHSNCGTIGNWWVAFVVDDTTFDWCSNVISLQAYFYKTCNSCNSGNVQRIPLSNACVVGYNYKTMLEKTYEDGDEQPIDDLFSHMYSDNGFCYGENNVSSSFYVCIECRPSVSYGSWSSNGTYTVQRTVTSTNPCTNAQTQTYQYACKANTYYVSSSDSGIVCAGCPTHGICTQTNGHTNLLSCESGYVAQGNQCVVAQISCPAGRYNEDNMYCEDCTEGTYQPNNNNTQGVTSCLVCPAYPLSNGGSLYGYTNGYGSTSITDCYLEGDGGMDSYVDANGNTFVLKSDCYYSGS